MTNPRQLGDDSRSPNAPAGKPPHLGIAIAAAVFGLIALLVGWIPGIGSLAAMVCGAVAVSCGRTAQRELVENRPPRSGMRLASVGIAAGYVGIAVGLVSLVGLLLVLGAVGSAWG